MKLSHLSPLLAVTLLLPLLSPAHGQLARERGLSQSESAAAGAVLGEVAGSRGNAADAAANAPTRRLSPDYYRVYSRRMQAPGTAKRVATATPAPKPLPSAKPKTTPVAAKPPESAGRKWALWGSAAATPAPAAKKPTTARRVAVATPAPKAKATPTPKPVVARPGWMAPKRVAVKPTPAVAVKQKPAAAKAKPVAVKPAPVPAKPKPVAVKPKPGKAKPVAGQQPTVTPRRVLMLPPGTKSRTIMVPAQPNQRQGWTLSPKSKKRDPDETFYVAPAPARTPVRSTFREPARR